MPVTDEPHSAREKERERGRAGRGDKRERSQGRGEGGGVEEVQRACRSSGRIY